MSTIKSCFFTFVITNIVVSCLSACAATGQSQTEDVTIKKLKKTCVLYTICRGDYKKIGGSVRELYFEAEKKGIRILSTPSYVYLNNPKDFPSEHRLTEIRLDVAPEAMKYSGKFGKMTDVKEVPGFMAAVAVKQQGVADPSPIYDALYRWIAEHGYIPAGAPIEHHLIGSTNSIYAKIKSEIMIPLMKPEAAETNDKQSKD